MDSDINKSYVTYHIQHIVSATAYSSSYNQFQAVTSSYPLLTNNQFKWNGSKLSYLENSSPR